jgi:hypothetical protein
VSLLEIGSKEKDWRAAIESLSRDAANAVIVVDSPETFQNGALIARLLADANLPAMFSFAESVEAGGLIAYSFDLTELYKRAANDIDAILRGAKPGDIPFYQVTKFDLSINLKTARPFGTSRTPGERRRGHRVNKCRSASGHFSDAAVRPRDVRCSGKTGSSWHWAKQTRLTQLRHWPAGLATIRLKRVCSPDKPQVVKFVGFWRWHVLGFYGRSEQSLEFLLFSLWPSGPWPSKTPKELGYCLLC